MQVRRQLSICRSNERSPGADAAGVGPVLVQMWPFCGASAAARAGQRLGSERMARRCAFCGSTSCSLSSSTASLRDALAQQQPSPCCLPTRSLPTRSVRRHSRGCMPRGQSGEIARSVHHCALHDMQLCFISGSVASGNMARAHKPVGTGRSGETLTRRPARGRRHRRPAPVPARTGPGGPPGRRGTYPDSPKSKIHGST